MALETRGRERSQSIPGREIGERERDEGNLRASSVGKAVRFEQQDSAESKEKPKRKVEPRRFRVDEQPW
eukprot:15478098-Alexandrium_andersonii.AAC.1